MLKSMVQTIEIIEYFDSEYDKLLPCGLKFKVLGI